MKFHFKKIVYIDHTELIFEDQLLYCTKKVTENHNYYFFLYLSRGWNTLPGASSDLDLGKTVMKMAYVSPKRVLEKNAKKK